MLAVAGEVLTLMAQIQVQLQAPVEMAEVVREEKLQQGLTERQTLVVAPAPGGWPCSPIPLAIACPTSA